jgi:hypothetical protein
MNNGGGAQAEFSTISTFHEIRPMGRRYLEEMMKYSPQTETPTHGFSVLLSPLGAA